MKWMLMLVSSFLLSCETTKNASTFYKPVENGDGFKIEKEDDSGVLNSTFKGNSATLLITDNYSIIAAYEYCSKHNLLTAYLGTLDLTKTTRYGVYPASQTLFLCLQNFKLLSGIGDYEDIKRDLVNSITNDFKGAILVKSTDNVFSKFQEGDAIISINNVRVEKRIEILLSLEKIKSKSVEVRLIRKGKIIKLTVPVLDDTEVAKLVTSKKLEAACEKLDENEIVPICPNYEKVVKKEIGN